MNEWGSGTEPRTSHFKMAVNGKFNDQNKLLSVNVDTSCGKLLFENDIVGQARFPLSQTYSLKVERPNGTIRKHFDSNLSAAEKPITSF